MRRVIDELDIVSVDANGRFRIYDIKTGKHSFYGSVFTRRGRRQIRSTKEQYTLQLSAYKHLFEMQYGVPIEDIGLLPFVISYDEDGNLTSIYYEQNEDGGDILPLSYNADIEGKDFFDESLENAPMENRSAIDPIISAARTLMGQMNMLEGELRSEQKAMLAGFIEKYLGRITDDNERAKMAVRLLDVAEKDITVFDRWLDSAADCGDEVMRIIDQARKERAESARQRTINMQKLIMAAGKKLEDAGYKDQEWMFERNKKGKLTGRYMGKYSDRFYEELREERRREAKITDDEERYRAAQRWARDHMVQDAEGNYVPNDSYLTDWYRNLSDAQREFYDFMMNIKNELDAVYPPSVVPGPYNAVKIRKNLMERLTHSDNKGRALWDAVKDSVMRRSDDVNYGGAEQMLDFEERKVHRLPVLFQRFTSGERMEDMSTDVVSTMVAYAAATNYYSEMDEVIDQLEMLRDILRMRQVGDGTSTEGLSRATCDVGGINQSNSRSKAERGLSRRLDDCDAMQIYVRFLRDESEILEPDMGEVANALNAFTALRTYVCNILAALTNATTSRCMNKIEAAAGEYFTATDLLTVDEIYASALPEFLGDFGQRIRTSKLSLFDELFDVLQEYDKEIHDIGFSKKTIATHVGADRALYFMSTTGEHWLQNRTAIALAHRYKLKHKETGVVQSLWDCLEKVPIDPAHPEYGAKLRIKEGYVRAHIEGDALGFSAAEDGKEFDAEAIYHFGRRAVAINEKLHGIYNKADMAAAQQWGIGRMGFMFRKWIKPAFNRRFAQKMFNYDLGQNNEGYYRTTARFVIQLAKELRAGETTIAASWDKLDAADKANIRRTVAEVCQFFAVSIAMMLLRGFSKQWSESVTRSWGFRLIKYQTSRLYTELGAMTPGLQMANEISIIQSPAAATSTIENICGLADLFIPSNYKWFYNLFGGEDPTIEQGQYKGHSRAVRALGRALPLYNTLYKGFRPEDAEKCFKRGYPS